MVSLVSVYIFIQILYYILELIQSWAKQLQTFSCYSKIFPHHKINGTSLLSPEKECRVNSPVTKQFKTWDLSKLGNFKKMPAMLGIDGEYPAGHPKSIF